MSPQTGLLPVCHQGDPAGRACLAVADWERGRGLLPCYQLEQIRLEPLILPPGGHSNSPVCGNLDLPGPGQDCMLAGCPLSSSGHPSCH